MKQLINSAILISGLVAVSACDFVTQAEFDNYVQENQRVQDILLCEARVDAYEDLLDEDEPDPTRRDEPTTTRRDLASCEEEYDRLVEINNSQSHIPQCRTDMQACTANPNNSLPECRACYRECVQTATWQNPPC